MRFFITVVLSIVFASVCLSQAAVRTEAASNVYKRYVAATTGDTLFTKAAAVAGSSIPTDKTSVVGYIATVTFNTVVASDSLILKNGAGTIAQIIFTASPPVLPFTVHYNARLDTSLIVVLKKTSDVTVSYRTTPLR